MKTRMTELFGIRYPIMLAGMNWLTTPKLVASVSNAGALGLLAGAQYNTDTLREAIREIRKLTDKPFGVNLALSLGDPSLIDVVIGEKVPIVNYSLGRPPEIIPLIQGVHAYGGKIIGTVATVKHARRAEEIGVDALAITGYEAAAHSGNVGAVVLIPQIVEAVKIPCIAAGGFADGKGLAAALALGAEGISMGTRLAATKEAEVPDTVKEIWVKATEEDTIIDPAFDGINCRVWRNKAAENILKKKAFPLFDAISAGLLMKNTLKMSWRQLFKTALKMRGQEAGIGRGKRGLSATMRFAIGTSLFYKAMEGDIVNGILLMGQTTGKIHDIPAIAELLERTVTEAKQVIAKLDKQIAN
ncbi:MAG: nitronate monooxygenase [Dehalococcoidales bacterium]|nr:nitronate monooxygenase [Dehalococcoidales bacterium]